MALSQTLKPALIILAALTALYALRHRSVGWHVAADFAPFLAAIFAGGVVTPLLLPWLPTRVFAVKGATAGALCIAAALAVLPGGAIETTGTALLGAAIASYMGMMFTGATTFTNLAGARLEVRHAMPAIPVCAGIGAAWRVAAALI
jgi:hypothetical protein